MNPTDIYLPEHFSETEQQSALDFIDKLRTHFGWRILAVVLFGSRARQQADPTSDMDLMVVLTEVDADVREAVRHIAADVWLENGIFLSTRVWSPEHWQLLKSLQTGLYQNICHDGIILFSLSEEPVLAR